MGCFSIDAPDPRSPAAEGAAMLQAQIDLAPQQFEAESRFRPQYARLNRALLAESLLGDEDIPGLYEIESESQRRRARRDIETIEELGPRASAALRGVNPQQQELMDELNQQVLEELRYGGDLDPELRRQIQQEVRSGQVARGVGLGRADIFEEAATLGRAGVAMRDRRRGQAASTIALNQQTQGDPFLALLGRPSQTVGMAGGVAQGVPSGMFQPFTAYGADLFNTNYNAEAAAKIAKYNTNIHLLTSGLDAVRETSLALTKAFSMGG